MPCFALEGQGNFVRRTTVFESGTFLYPTLARGLIHNNHGGHGESTESLPPTVAVAVAVCLWC